MGEVRSGRDGQMAPAAVGPVQQAGAVRQHRRAVWLLIGLKVTGDVLRSRRSYELAIVGAILVAALAHQARENQAQMLARLIAWDKRHTQALRRELTTRPGHRKTK